ncbi:MAG TPA: ABC transporter ATP-binding protein [Pseudomonadota bacterium]|nr:ABC transporter ATP-binding protein [Pseudomonadota bacterium]
MLTAHGCSFSYGERRVFSDVSLSLHPYELLALIGPNGAGKTTLLHVLSGIQSPQQGHVTIQTDGKEEELFGLSVDERARHIAVVEQSVAPAFDFSVKEMVSFGRYPHRHTKHDHSSIVNESMEAVGVSLLSDRMLSELSAGEKQRVFLALALAQKPRVLLLDEPLSHLDPKHQQTMISLLQTLAQKGLAVLWSVHELNWARKADRVALLCKGGLLAVGPPSDVLTQAHLETAYETKVRLIPTEPGEPPLILFDRE